MVRLPKVPDLLKIQKTKIYSKKELHALRVHVDMKFGWNMGYGKGDDRESTIEDMLSGQLSEEDRTYRGDFFSELMQSEQWRKNFKKVVSWLPDREMEYMWPDSTSLKPAVRRMAALPRTLEELARFDGESKLSTDLARFCNQFLRAVPELTKATAIITEQYPNLFGKGYLNGDEVREIKAKLVRFDGLVSRLNALKKQLFVYVIFSRLCEGGSRPEFLDPDRSEGHIINGRHPDYGEWERNIYGPDRFIPAIPNDVIWGPDKRLTLITGSNSRGKSVYLRMIGLNVLLAMNGFYAVADEMKLSPVRRVWPCFDIGDEPGAGHLETGQRYVAQMRDEATRDDLLLIDEPAQGTEPAVEYALAQGLISNLAHHGGFNSFIVTHDIEMMREFEGLEGACFRRVADYDDKENKYKLMDGISKGGYGMRLAKKLGTDPDSLKKIISRRMKKGQL